MILWFRTVPDSGALSFLELKCSTFDHVQSCGFSSLISEVVKNVDILISDLGLPYQKPVGLLGSGVGGDWSLEGYGL